MWQASNCILPHKRNTPPGRKYNLLAKRRGKKSITIATLPAGSIHHPHHGLEIAGAMWLALYQLDLDPAAGAGP